MKRTRILVLATSFPEPDNREMETLCTIGCTPQGRLIRLYPIPLRYLPNHLVYRPHDWVIAPVARSGQDRRPETYNVMSKQIMADGRLIPGRGWTNLDRLLSADTSWHYASLEALLKAQQTRQASVGFVKVTRVAAVWIKPRTDKEQKVFSEKMQVIKDTSTIPAARLACLPYRAYVQWSADADPAAPLYETEICSWKLLAHIGAVSQVTATERLQRLLDPQQYDLGFMMASFKSNPQYFKVIGLWRPKKQDVLLRKAQLKLF